MDATSLPSNPKHNALAVQANVIEELTSQVEKLRKLAIEKEIDYADKLQQKNDQIEDLEVKKRHLENNVHSYAVSIAHKRSNTQEANVAMKQSLDILTGIDLVSSLKFEN